jgi:hypothetical protein
MTKIHTVGLILLILCACLVGPVYADLAPPDNGCDCALSGRGTAMTSPWLLAGILTTSGLLIRYRHRRR